jgi:cytochrome c-type biogenesis protein CcmH/NrfG
MARLSWWLLPALLLAVLTRQLQDENVAQYVFVPAWWQRPLVALDATAFYLWKLVVPWGLAVDHGRSPQQVLSGWSVYIVWLVPIALLAVCAWLPSRRVWLTAAAIFVAGILPVSGLMSFTFQDLSTVAERYVYLAMLGPALAGAWLLAHPPCLRWRSEISLALVLLALCTVRQTGFWQDTETLFAHGLDVNPDSTLCLTAVALQHVEVQDYKTAEELLLHVAEVNPREANVWKNLGALYMRQERPDDAMRVLERAVELHGSEIGPKMDLALLCLQQQNYERAMQLLGEVLEVEPDFMPAHTYLGAALVNRGRHAEAIEHWQAVVRVDPQNVEIRQMLGESLAQTSQYQAALEQFHMVLQLRPDDPRATEYIRLIERQPANERRLSP